MRVIADELEFPEGPVYLQDGSIIVVEIRRRCVTRIWDEEGREGGREGKGRTRRYHVGGGPNGAALGPDGFLYICNNGGFRWRKTKTSFQVDNSEPPEDYRSGSIQKLDLETGEVFTLYTHVGGEPLKGPNDIVFDSSGGFWFTDFGKGREKGRKMDVTGVYYALPDGSMIKEMIFPLLTPNGIGLSPDNSKLYVAETLPGRILEWELSGAGELSPKKGGGRVIYALGPAGGNFDSLAIDKEGNIVVATLGGKLSGFLVISPQGVLLKHVHTGDQMTTNFCFGGKNFEKGYGTLSKSGKLVEMDWEIGGFPLPFCSTFPRPSSLL